MKVRFLELWERIRAKSSADEEFARLVLKYSESHRFYHNLTHIQSCLKDFYPIARLIGQPDLVEMAVWYHDIVYDPKARDSEERSAHFVEGVGLRAKLPRDFIEVTKRLILATKYQTLPVQTDEKFLTDIDLSIFGKSEAEFDEYENNVGREYSHVLSERFRQGRKEVLQSFLDRNSIYKTDFFREKYEMLARNNLARSIQKLS